MRLFLSVYSITTILSATFQPWKSLDLFSFKNKLSDSVYKYTSNGDNNFLPTPNH